MEFLKTPAQYLVVAGVWTYVVQNKIKSKVDVSFKVTQMYLLIEYTHA